MARKRRSFSTEFKREAAGLILDQGYSVAQAARAVDGGETPLRRWIDQLRAERGGVTPKSKALTPEQQRIQELESRINRLEREKAILKKATVDSTGQRKYTLQLLHRCQVVECFPRSVVQLSSKCI